MRGRTHRRWRRTRGAAMAEMALTLPMMILMWAGVDYFRQSFARRMETLSQSHAAAWALAYSNDGSCYTASGKGPFPGFTGQADGPTKDLAGKFDSSMFMYGIAHGPKSLKTNSSRWSGTVASNTTITCNEVVPTDDRNVLTPLVDFIKSLL